MYSIWYIIYTHIYIYKAIWHNLCVWHVVSTTQHAVFSKVISVDLELDPAIPQGQWLDCTVHEVWNSQEDNSFVCVFVSSSEKSCAQNVFMKLHYAFLDVSWTYQLLETFWECEWFSSQTHPFFLLLGGGGVGRWRRGSAEWQYKFLSHLPLSVLQTKFNCGQPCIFFFLGIQVF